MKNKTTIIVAILFVVTLAVGGGMVYGFSVLTQWKQNEQAIRQEIEQEDLRSRRLSSLKNSFERVKEDEAKLDGYFYHGSEEDWLRFVTNMEQLARYSGVAAQTTANDFVPGKPFGVTMNISGSWKDCYRFFRFLETFPTRLVIRSFSIQGEGNPVDAKVDAKWTGVVSIELASVR